MMTFKKHENCTNINNSSLSPSLRAQKMNISTASTDSLKNARTKIDVINAITLNVKACGYQY
jgi:hypothetical protein